MVFAVQWGETPPITDEALVLNTKLDPTIYKMYKDQREKISVIEKSLEGMRAFGKNRSLTKQEEESLSAKHQDLDEMTQQLREILKSQVRCLILEGRRTTSEMYVALDVKEPSKKKARRTRRGGVKHRKRQNFAKHPDHVKVYDDEGKSVDPEESEAEPEPQAEETAAKSKEVKASSEKWMPAWNKLASLAKTINEDLPESDHEESDEDKFHPLGTHCVRCLENGVNTPARLNSQSGQTLCEGCTRHFYNPMYLYSHDRPGRAVFWDKETSKDLQDLHFQPESSPDEPDDPNHIPKFGKEDMVALAKEQGWEK